VVGALPWQIVVADGVGTAGIPTVGVTVTGLITFADGPLHPMAVTSIFTVPEKPFAHVITPVEASILPAAALLKDQLKPALLVAVVV
jgi:hypothetical protein